MIDSVAAVVLAGGGMLAGEEEQGWGRESKALLPLNGRPMVDYVVAALKGCPEIARIVLVGPPDLTSIYGGEGEMLFADPGCSPLESFTAGVEALGCSGEGEWTWVLACTGDIPFLTPEAVSDFLARCREREADFYYPIIRQEAAERRFPGVKRTYARLRDGTFTGGNLFLVHKGIIDRCLGWAEEFVRLRKKPAALARLVGIGLLWRYLTGQLTVSEAEQRISKLVGARGAAVITPYPEIGVDVDKPSDWKLAEREFARSGQ